MKEEFTYGELVEVRDADDHEWKKRVCVGTLPHTKGCWCMREGQDETNYTGWAEGWVQIRKIQPKPQLEQQTPRFCKNPESSNIESLKQEVNNLKAVFNASIDHLNNKIKSLENQIE
jgi:hypothetical protein